MNDSIAPTITFFPCWAAVGLMPGPTATKDSYISGWVSEASLGALPALRVDLPASDKQGPKTWLVPLHAVRFVQEVPQERAIGYIVSH